MKIRKELQTFISVQVPARMIGKIKPSEHHSSSVKAAGGGYNIRLLLSHLSIDIDREIRCVSNPTVPYMCSTGRTPSFFPFVPLLSVELLRSYFSLDLEDGHLFRFERRGFQYVSR